MKRFAFVAVAIAALFAGASHAQSDKPLLLREPTLNKTQIAFVYGGDLWLVSRDGGNATRLTAGTGSKSDPHFSPDGTQIAFSAEYEGRTNVYVVSVSGGEPRRVTYDPGPDIVSGWTNDGKSILFASTRDVSNRGVFQLFTVPATGGFATALPLPRAYEGSYSTDGTHLAYRPVPMAFGTWSHYRGGTSSAIWIANLADSRIERVPREDSVDVNPVWIGNTIYFLSDRNGSFSIFAYDTNSKDVHEVVTNHALPIRNMSADPGAIVYEQFGAIHIYDLASSSEHAVDIHIAADLPEVRPHFDNVAKQISNAVISPTGVRAAFEAHGEILTAPADKGDIRNLTNSPGIADRDPAWAPDGKQIAYFSDESGEYELHIRDQSGMGAVQKISLGNPASYFYSPKWSPDSKKIAYTDKRLNLWYIDLDKKTPVKVDTGTYEVPQRNIDPSWSPDSQWITYTKLLANHLRAVFVYSLEAGKATQITDGLSDARFAAFDRNGKYLYFTASTNIGPTTGWLDLSSFGHDVTRNVYVIVLRKDLPSPLAPESDEEKASPAKSDEAAGKKKDDGGVKAATGGEKDKDTDKDKDKDKSKPEAPVKVTIDFDGIGQRILALPIPAKEYQQLAAGKTGEVFLLETEHANPDADLDGGAPPVFTVQKFDLKSRKTEPLISGIQSFDLSFDGEKFLYQQGESWTIAPTTHMPPPPPGANPSSGRLKVESMEVKVDPRAEWKQMFNEIWRIERDFFYDPHYHGMDLAALKKKYEPYLDRLGSRDDLNYLFAQMLGELNVGHMFVGGGDIPEVKPIQVGLLGADYAIENGRYRFERIYNGENWDPQLHAPLTQPGVNIEVGDYLLAVNGNEVRGSDDIFSFFQETSGKQVVLKVGPKPDGSGSREVTVVPVQSDFALRNRAWVEDNRRKVEELSKGRLAYVYLPDTATGGFTYFNRYFFAQVGKQGAVIDERYNGGGAAADYVIEYLQRKIWNYFMTREGEPFSTPQDGIFGPKVMLTNEFAGSGGDLLPWLFRHVALGPLVGKRTWGGLVGIYDYPQLMDGGFVTAPRVAFYTTDSKWDVENHGVPPDVEVELDPHAWREGHDAQLEKAVEIALQEVEKNPPPATPQHPPFPDYSHVN
jgi:tricorn protease